MDPARDPLRLFVGVEVPVSVGRAIDTATDRWRQRLPSVRWTPPEGRHVTLRFLGDIDLSQVEGIAVHLRAAARSVVGFDARFSGVGGFPSAGRARVMWIGLDDREGDWDVVASAVREALADIAGSEPQRFTPHVTLGRSVAPIALPRPLPQTDVLRPFPAGSITLFQSHLDRPRARYTRLVRFPLAQG